MAVLLKIKATKEKLPFFKTPKMLLFAFLGLKTTKNRLLLDKFVLFSLFFAKNGFFKMAALAKWNEAKKAHFKYTDFIILFVFVIKRIKNRLFSAIFSDF